MQDLLQRARTALAGGQHDLATVLARDLLARADDAKERHFQAQALTVLAEVDRLFSRYRRAHDAAQRAAHLFRLAEDIDNEIIALTMVAHCASNLGRNEEAVEAALLAARLCEPLPIGPFTVAAQNYLGVAYLWSRDWARAHQALDLAQQAAAQCQPPVPCGHVALNHALADTLRLTEHHEPGSGLLQTDELRSLAARLGAVLEPNADLPANGWLPTYRALGQISLCIVHSWLGEFELAAQMLALGRPVIEALPLQTWLHAFSQWAQADLAWNQRHYGLAEQAAVAMVKVAAAVENEQLACIGRLRAARIAEEQNKLVQALDELRQLRSHEQLIRAEAMASRDRAVQWQIDARRTQDNLNTLELTSAVLRRQSLEDMLTGIANRRGFEQAVQSLLERTDEETLCLALVDVDKFKSINDNYSHALGDQVLKAIAQVMLEQLRKTDLPARLGGDEFVMALSCGLEQAQRVCERIRQQVRGLDWSPHAQGLSVDISIGLTQALPADTLAALMHRADLAMYTTKKQRG